MGTANILLSLVATLLWGLWAIFEKKLSLSINVYWANVYYGFTGLTLFPLYLYVAIKYGGIFHFKIETLSWAYLSLISASSAGIIYLYLLSKNPTNWVTAFTASYPIVTLLIGAIFLKEALTLNAILGTVIIIVGLIILNL